MEKKRICCSKKIVVCSYVITITLTVIMVLAMFLTESIDLSPLVTIVSLAWAEVAACNAFYFWKAKGEKRYEYAERMVNGLADKYGIDAVVSLASTIFIE